MKINERTIKYILNNLSLSDTERNWLKFSIKKHGSVEAAGAEIKDFLKNKLHNLEEGYKQLEDEEKEIKDEIRLLQSQVRKEIEVTAINNYRDELINYKKFKLDQKKRVADISSRSENFKEKIKLYRERARGEAEQNKLKDIRQKLK